ncbi:hypothetical protein [Nakamurella deserti]|uniref:hypothetical protein n=1 Tax=Nakamurella deserti TaxID=2164074 RepID=UPI001300B0D1|nr:hypothetical protein [Nakamurella deserti]
MRAPSGAAGRPREVPAVPVPVPPPDAGSALTRRRSVGLIVLVLAVVAALGGSQLVGVGVMGRAAATAVPLPPAVGSCLQIAEDDSATVVSCAEPHAGELAMTWRAGVPPVAAGALVRYPHFSVTRPMSHPDIDTRCIGWAERYTGWDRYIARHDDDLWLAPQPLVAGRMVHAPLDEAVATLGWTGCAVVTGEPTYVGSVRDTAFAPRFGSTAARPDAVSVCLQVTGSGLDFTDCTAAHNTEMIGSVNLTQRMMAGRSVTLDRTADEVAAACRELAVERIGRADPTFGGQVEIVAESVWQRSLQDHKPTSSAWLIPDCLARVVGDGTVRRSLVEWGEQPLPLSPTR